MYQYHWEFAFCFRLRQSGKPLQQAYYNKHLSPSLGPAKGEMAETPKLFSLTVANDEKFTHDKVCRVRCNFFMTVPKVGFLVVKNPKTFIEYRRVLYMAKLAVSSAKHKMVQLQHRTSIPYPPTTLWV